jgi:hypothetical protein
MHRRPIIGHMQKKGLQDSVIGLKLNRGYGRDFLEWAVVWISEKGLGVISPGYFS